MGRGAAGIRGTKTLREGAWGLVRDEKRTGVAGITLELDRTRNARRSIDIIIIVFIAIISVISTTISANKATTKSLPRALVAKFTLLTLSYSYLPFL